VHSPPAIVGIFYRQAGMGKRNPAPAAPVGEPELYPPLADGIYLEFVRLILPALHKLAGLLIAKHIQCILEGELVGVEPIDGYQ